ncbi:class I SAM-dependent methyltransferase [archaeon]|nr:MAG: class I SAM-dependent methyltransferase [archaeon]
MGHYFSQDDKGAHDIVSVDLSIDGHALSFDTDAGVFSKGKLDKGTAILIDALPPMEDKSVLDLGCGWGAIGIIIAKRHPGARVHLSDINPRAVAIAKKNARKNDVDVMVHRSDILEAIDETFDVIVTNPPIRAGKDVVYAMVKQSHEHLAAGGAFYAVVRSKQGAKSFSAEVERVFGNVTIIARSAGYKVFEAVRR